MEKYSNASIQSQTSLSILNTGQAAIIAIGQGVVLALAAVMVKSGEVRLGQFVAANLIVIQLYQPLNLLGTVYREITQGLVDMEAMFRLLTSRGSAGRPARTLRVPAARPVRGCGIRLIPKHVGRASVFPAPAAWQSWGRGRGQVHHRVSSIASRHQSGG
jgi:ATP-binding cassette subfamily B protein